MRLTKYRPSGRAQWYRLSHTSPVVAVVSEAGQAQTLDHGPATPLSIATALSIRWRAARRRAGRGRRLRLAAGAMTLGLFAADGGAQEQTAGFGLSCVELLKL